jgi:endogenous inhibitor of DNA gyrase (YacG/DUF329 family)
MSVLVVSCPTCKAAVSWTAEQRFKPFCSERCRLIDLGEWFSEEKRIPDTTPATLDECDD